MTAFADRVAADTYNATALARARGSPGFGQLHARESRTSRTVLPKRGLAGAGRINTTHSSSAKGLSAVASVSYRVSIALIERRLRVSPAYRELDRESLTPGPFFIAHSGTCVELPRLDPQFRAQNLFTDSLPVLSL